MTRAVLRALNGDPAELRGVGPRGALRIRQWRDTNGAFRTVSSALWHPIAPYGTLWNPREPYGTLWHPIEP